MKNSTHNLILAALCASTIAVPVGLILAAPVMREQPEAATEITDAYFGTKWSKDMPGARLIGFGCAPNRDTLLAMEEDEFPQCEAISAVADVCGPLATGGDVTLTANECRAYWGDGY